MKINQPLLVLVNPIKKWSLFVCLKMLRWITPASSRCQENDVTYIKPCMLEHKLVPFRLRAVPVEFRLRSVERTCFIQQHFCDDETSHNERSTVNRNNEALDWRMSCSRIQITRRWSKTSPLSQQNLLASSSLKITKSNILQFLSPVYTCNFLVLFQRDFKSLV